MSEKDTAYVALPNHQRDLILHLAPDFTILLVNEAYCSFSARSRDQLLGTDFLALLPGEERLVVSSMLQRLTPDTPTAVSEFVDVAADGTWRWNQWSFCAAFDCAGAVVEYQCTGHDITERKCVEEELREREQRYSAIVANAAMGIVLVDAYGQFLECNPAFVAMTGYLPEEIAFLTLSEVTAPEDWEQEQQQLAELWEGRSAGCSMEKRIITKTGQVEWVQAISSTVRDADGIPQYAVQLLEVISDRKAAERVRLEYEERLRALTLNATLAEERERRRIAQNLHDQIGQSLAVARLQLGKLPAAFQEPERLQAQIEDIRTLLSEALDYSRTVTSELSPPILHELGLVPALRWLAGHFTARYHLHTELEAASVVPALSTEQRVVLYHTVRELLFNVVKHAQATRAVVRVASDGLLINVAVEDDGCGMRAGSGEGFGLFSVRERVSQLDGEFTMDSSADGTCCHLRLPVTER